MLCNDQLNILLDLSLYLFDVRVNGIDIKKLLRKTAKQLNCNSVRFYNLNKHMGKIEFVEEESIPKRDIFLDEELKKIWGSNFEIPTETFDSLIFPVVLENDRTYTHLVHLKDIGMIVLKRNEVSFSREFLLYLDQVFDRLTVLLKEIQMKEEVDRSSHLAAIGQISSGVGHEINSSLTTLVSSFKILGNKLNFKDEIQKEEFDHLNRLTERIVDIVKGVRQVSYNESNAPLTVVNMFELFKECEFFTSILVANSPIMVTYQKDLVKDLNVFGRKTQLSQVIINIVKNAIEAIESHDAPWVKIEVEPKGQKVILKIIDSGSGIPKEVQSQIFSGFHTSKEKGKGTGIGLSLAQKHLESQGGSVRIDNDASNTTFVIELRKTSLEDRQS